MKNIKINGLAGLALFALSVSATDYDNAKFDNYIDGQGVNTVLEDAQFIICSLSRFGTEALAGDGTYKATIYSDECEGGGAAATDSTQGTTAPTSSQTASTSTTTGGTTAAETQKEVDTIIINTGFSTADEQTTKAWIINDEIWDERENRSPKSITYLLNNQTAAASTSNKFGNFDLRWQAATYGNKQSELPEWYDCGPESSENYQYSWCSDGVDLGRGILKASGSSIKFKENSTDGQNNLVADFRENGDIAGVYSKNEGFQDDSLRNPDCDGIDGDWWECQSQAYRDSNTSVLGIFAFGIDDANSTYCTKMTQLFKVDWSKYDEATDGPTLTNYTLSGKAGERLEKQGWDVTEKCFSLAKSDAISDIWDYGVFNSNGSQYKPQNQAFPIKTKVTINDVEKNVHGYASYWGVSVDGVYQNYITDTTSWTRDGDNSDTPVTYNTKPRKLSIEKREKTFQALNEIDGLSLNMWFNDSYWSDEFVKIGLPKVEPWNGAIKFKTNKAVFTDYNNGISSDPLTYGLYGVHDGAGTYVTNLVGAKLDKDNLRKMIKNDASDPGKPMNLTMAFQEFPVYKDYNPREFMYIYLCNREFSTNQAMPYNFDQLTGITDGQCMRLTGELLLSGDGTDLTLSSIAGDEGYTAAFMDMASGNQLTFNNNNWNQGGNTYDLKITKGGIGRPAGMELRLQNLLTKFGGLSQGDADGGDIAKGLESFLDSTSSFTFMVASWMNLYDHEGNRFNKIRGTFAVDSTPPATVYVDDVKVAEHSESFASSFSVSLSKAQASAVTFDYAISASSTASSADYTNLTNGTVTIAAGATASTIAFNVEADDLVEGSADEKLILTLSNPTNAVLGRSSAVAYIYDDDTNRIVYEDYVGTFSAETQTFTVTDGLLFNPNYTKTALPKPITFTTADWLTNMKKTYNVGTDYEQSYWRDLYVWSQDTGQNYRIRKESMENPTSNTVANGLSSETYTTIDASELPAKLYCLNDCLETSRLQAHYADVKTQADPAGDATYTGSVSRASVTPYADVGPYYKTTFSITTTYNAGTEYESRDTREYKAGEYIDGILATNVFEYDVANGVVSDSSGNELKIGIDWGISYPSEKIRGAKVNMRNGGWSMETAWGVSARDLVDATTLALLECDYTTTDSVKKYNNEHAEHKKNGKTNDLRYCAGKLNADNVLVTYNLRADTYKQYDIYKTDGSSVVFEQPKTLYFKAPTESSWGDDAGKEFRLELHGDHLGGIPGSVINIDTGEDLGEYVQEWNDSYRWVQRFVLPDGSVLTDNTSDDTYITKALRGQQWLGVKDSAIGSVDDLLTLKNNTDLLNNTDINFELSQNASSDYECNITKEVDDGNGGTRTETDYEVCYALDRDSDEYAAAWTLVRSYTSCQGRIDWQIDQVTASINQQKQAAVDGGYEYNGPQKWQDMVAGSDYGDFADYINRDQARCKPIGSLPTDLINGGEPAVINGEVVYDPTP